MLECWKTQHSTTPVPQHSTTPALRLGIRRFEAGLGKSPAHAYLACGMNIMQMTKRIFLLVLVNILVMTTITLVLWLLGVGHYLPQGQMAGLAVFCLVWGFGGAFISLGLSRLMAKWMMGVQVIPSDTREPALQELVETVHGLARSAGLAAARRLPHLPGDPHQRHLSRECNNPASYGRDRWRPVHLMRERATLHGGTVEWSGRRNGGTTVTVRLPRGSGPQNRDLRETGRVHLTS